MKTARDVLDLCEYDGYAAAYKDIKGIKPGEKDIGRIVDILDKANGNKEKAMQLVRVMANAIADLDKAQRRAAAALALFPKEWAQDAAMAFLSKF
jgi:hypothetical protein